MQTIIVDMTPGFRMPTIYYSQGDIGTQFAVDLRSRFGDSLPAGATVTIQATKPSGFGFSEAATSVTNGVAVFTTVAGMTDEAGRFAAELKVEASGITLFTANFYMNGEASTHPEGTIDGSEETVIPELTQLVERVETAASSVLDMTVEAETLAAGSQATYSYDEDTNTATFGIPQGEAGAGAAGVTASAYSSSSTYAVGDYVIHNSNLYRCTTAITTAEAFTAAHWTQVVLADDVTDVKSDINVNGNATSDSLIISNAKKVTGITSDSNADIYLSGKNLLRYRESIASTTISGVTITLNSDGSISFSGTSTAQIVFALTDSGDYNRSLEIGLSKYIVSGGTPDIQLQVLYNDNAQGTSRGVLGTDLGDGVKITHTNITRKYELRYVVLSGKTVDTILYPMLEMGEEITEYEPFEFLTKTNSYDESTISTMPKHLTIANSLGDEMDVLYVSAYSKLFDMAMPQEYGAVGDGINDDTNALQRCFDAESTIFLPKATYRVNDSGITIKHPCVVYGNKSVIKKFASNSAHYKVIDIVSNDVTIYDLTCVGDNNNKSVEGEWGHGFALNADNIKLLHCKAVDCYGDGFYIGGEAPSNMVLLDGCVADHSRRNGYAVIDSKGFVIANCSAIKSNGATPMAGIDLEPNSVDQAIHGIVSNFLSENNRYSAMNINLVNVDLTSDIDITVDGLLSINDGDNQHGSGMFSIFQVGNCNGVINATNITIKKSVHTPFFYQLNAEKGARINLQNLTAISCNSINSTQFRFVPNDSQTTDTIKNISVKNFTVIDKNNGYTDIRMDNTSRKMEFIFDQTNESVEYDLNGSVLLKPTYTFIE